MTDLVESLAQAFYEAAYMEDGVLLGLTWDELEDNDPGLLADYRKGARAALSQLNIPLEAGPVNVGEAIAKIQALYRFLLSRGESEDVLDSVAAILHELGEELPE